MNKISWFNKIKLLFVKRKWINVQEIQPYKYDTYLICNENNIIEIALFSNDKWHNDSGGKVKYWMPLPELPIV